VKEKESDRGGNTPRAVRMAEGILSYLYLKFLLRDVLGKMVPGAVLLAGLTIGITGQTLSALFQAVGGLPTSVLLLVIALTWVLGFVVQEVGTMVGMLKTEAHRFPWPRDAAEEERRRERVSTVLVGRHRYSEAQREHLERLIVILEAAGNTGVAILLFGVIWLLVKPVPDSYWHVRPSVALILVGTVLILRHHRASGLLTVADQLLAADVDDRSRLTGSDRNGAVNGAESVPRPPRKEPVAQNEGPQEAASD